MAPERVQGVVDGFVEGLLGAARERVRVRVVARQEEAFGPGTYDRDGRVRGAWDPERGEVVLVAEHLGSAREVRAVLRHEVRGHVGWALLQEADRAELAGRILEATGRSRWLRRLRAEVERAEGLGASAEVVAEEVFARVAESGRSAVGRAWDQVLLWLARRLRALGLPFVGTDAAALRVLAEDMGRAIRAGNVGAGAGVRLSAYLKPGYETTTYERNAKALLGSHRDEKWLMPPIKNRDGTEIHFFHTMGRGVRLPKDVEDVLREGVRSIVSAYGLNVGSNLPITFVSTNSDRNALARGSVDGVSIRFEVLRSLMRNGVGNKAALRELLELIGHEMTHVHQLRTGRLSADGALWNGEDGAESGGRPYWKRGWASRPWEKEANHMQGVLAKRAIDDLTAQGLVPVEMRLESAEPAFKERAKENEGGGFPNTGNAGTVDPANPDIRYSRGPRDERNALGEMLAVRAVATGERSLITGNPVFSVLAADGSEVGRIRSAETADAAVTIWNNRGAAQQGEPPIYVLDDAQPKRARDARSNWRIYREPIGYGDAADDYYYHVTPYQTARQIIRDGLVPGAGRQSMADGFYREYSRGKVFVTERGGVPYWMARIEEHLQAQHDNPPALAVVRIKKSDAPKLERDELGSRDAGADAWYSQVRFSRSPLALAGSGDRGGSPVGGGGRLMAAVRGALEDPQGRFGDAWTQAVPALLGALTLRQLDDVGRGYLPGTEGYTAAQQRMDARRNEMVDEAGGFAAAWEAWAAKHRAEAQSVADLMHAATIAQVDPSDYQVLKVAVKLGPGDLFWREREATGEEVAKLAKKARKLARSRAREDRGLAPYYMAAAKKLKRAAYAELERKKALPGLKALYQQLSVGTQFRAPDGGLYANRSAAQRAIAERQSGGDLAGRLVAPREVRGGWVIQELGGQEIFQMARDLYKKRSDQMLSALLARVEQSVVMDPVSKRALAAAIRAEWESPVDEKGNPRVGPYFPLQRFGRFYAFLRRFPEGEARRWRRQDGEAFASKESAMAAAYKRRELKGIEVRAVEVDGGWELVELGEKYFAMFETVRERTRAVRALEADGWRLLKQGLTEESRREVEAVSEGFVAEAVAKLEDSGAKEEADMLYQMYLTQLHEMSIRKKFIHRKKTKGFSRDALRSFGWNMTRLGHQVAKLEHVPTLERILKEIEDEKKAAAQDNPGVDQTLADAFLQELKRRHQWVVSPDNAAWTNFTSALGFFFYLGLTPGAALVNLSQVPIVALPVLAARFGWKGSAQELTRALVDVGRGFNPVVVKGFMKGLPVPSLAANLSDDERRAFAEWDQTGVRDRTQAHNLAGIGDSDTFWNGPTFNRAMAIVSSMFHGAEVVNRDATLLAAYRLARAKGMGHNQAVAVAERMTWDSHFDYSNANRARWMQSNAAKALLMFRSYSQHMTYLMWRNLYEWTRGESQEVRAEARTRFLGVLGMTGLFAGALGMPMLGAVFMASNLAAAAFGDDDEPWDSEAEFRAWLARTFPGPVADTLDRGAVTTLTGLDWASRVSLRELWFRSPDRDLDGAGTYQHIVEQILGPLGGIAARPFQAADMIAEGHWDRAAEALSPKFLKDALQAARYSGEGVQTLRGDPVVEQGELGPYAIVWKAMGMNPDRVSVRWDGNRAIKLYERRILDRRSRLMTAYAMAVIHQDREAAARVLDKIRAFNRAFPELPISGRSVRNSVRRRLAYSERADGGIVVNPRLEGRVRAIGGFAE